MGFNSHKYKTVKIDNKEYSEIKINGTSIWRKPINFSRVLAPVDPDDYTTVILNDPEFPILVVDNIIKVKHLGSNYYSDVNWEPASEGRYGRFTNINYRDLVKLNLAQSCKDFGYIVVQNNSTIKVNGSDTAMLFDTEYEALNDFSLYILLTYIKCFVSVTIDSGVQDYRIYRTVGTISSSIFGLSDDAISESDRSFFGDVLTIYARIDDGYTCSSDTKVINFSGLPTNNTSITIPVTFTTRVIQYTVNYTAGTGVGTVTIKRTYRDLPSPSAEEVIVANGGSINYGDSISVTATASTGYTMDSYTSTYINVRNNLNISLTAHLNKGKIKYDASQITGVSDLEVYVTHNNQRVRVYNSDSSNTYWAYYGDTIEVVPVLETGYEIASMNSTFLAQPLTDEADININTLADIVTQPKAYTLTVNADSASIASYTLERTLSPMGGTTGAITTNDPVYLGDKIRTVSTANTNYVVGSGYGTTSQKTFTCDSFDSNDNYTITLIGTYTQPLVLGQIASNGTTLDNEDLSNLKVRYPDDYSSLVYYDSTKRVRVDEYVLYLTTEQTSPDVARYMHALSIQSNDNSAIEYMTYNNASYFKLSPVHSYSAIFSPLDCGVKIRVVSDEVSNANPVDALTSVYIVSSKYAGTSQGSTTYSIGDYDYPWSGQSVTEVQLDIKYKDTIKINMDNVQGWTIIDQTISKYGEQPYTVPNNSNIVIDNGTINVVVNREINYYNLIFTNTYGWFTNIEINGNTVETDWKSPYGSTTRTYSLPYGSVFKKTAEPMENNSPMGGITISHNDNQYYTVKQNTNVYQIYSSELLSLSNLNMVVNMTKPDSWSSYYLPSFNISFINSNTSYVSEYTIHVKITRYDDTDINPELVYYEADHSVASGGSRSIFINYTEFSIDYNKRIWSPGIRAGVRFTLEIYVKGMLIDWVMRTDSSAEEVDVTYQDYSV